MKTLKNNLKIFQVCSLQANKKKQPNLEKRVFYLSEIIVLIVSFKITLMSRDTKYLQH